MMRGALTTLTSTLLAVASAFVVAYLASAIVLVFLVELGVPLVDAVTVDVAPLFVSLLAALLAGVLVFRRVEAASD